MLCSNCGKNEANIRYTRIINGEKTEFALCEDCAKKIGLEDIDFSMPINFSNFLSDFFEEDALLPSFTTMQTKKCSKCGLSYDDFAKSGKFGCAECYNTFSNKLESVLKNLHGSAKHIGRAPKNKITESNNNETMKNSEVKNAEVKINEKEEKLKDLNTKLQQAIKEERYEDAAKIRDEIKKIK